MVWCCESVGAHITGGWSPIEEVYLCMRVVGGMCVCVGGFGPLVRLPLSHAAMQQHPGAADHHASRACIFFATHFTTD
jgi:hypothetical protein